MTKQTGLQSVLTVLAVTIFFIPGSHGGFLEGLPGWQIYKGAPLARAPFIGKQIPDSESCEARLTPPPTNGENFKISASPYAIRWIRH